MSDARHIIVGYESMLPGQPFEKSGLEFRIFTNGFEAASRATSHLSTTTSEKREMSR